VELTKDAHSEAIERLRRRRAAGEIDDAGFRAMRAQLLERRVAQRPFDGPDRRDAPAA
jgi:hypothetical protein